MFFVDTDILSAFVKVGGIKYLKALFQSLNIAPSIMKNLRGLNVQGILIWMIS